MKWVCHSAVVPALGALCGAVVGSCLEKESPGSYLPLSRQELLLKL